MKEIVLRFFTYIGILYLIDGMITGFTLETTIATMVLALLLSITHVFLSPIIKFFTIPLNLVTFGVFNFILSCIYLYFFNLIIPGFKITDGSIGPVINKTIQIPEVQMSLVGIIIFSSILLALLNNIITWTYNKR